MLVIFNGEHDVAAAAVAADGTCVEEISGKTTNSGLASRDGNSISIKQPCDVHLLLFGMHGDQHYY